MPGRPEAPTIADVDAAAGRIAPYITRTPLVKSVWLSDCSGASVWIKLETVQATGSFKIRGAANALVRLKERAPETRTVVTASAGNHGVAVAYAASRLDIRVRVHVPAFAPLAKRRTLARLGADVIEQPSYDAAETASRADAAASGVPFVSPYNDADVIAGAGTVMLEMLRERPDLDAVVVPLGGGGLLSGTAIVARARSRSRMLIVGAEAAASPVFTAALAAGEVTTVEVSDTLADGLAGNMEPGSRTFPIVKDFVDRVVRVSEETLTEAMRGLIFEERLIVEGAGAASAAGVLGGELDLAGKQVGVVLSGRNVDAAVIRKIVAGS